MSFAPASLLNLRDYLKTQTGLSSVSLGIVGDSKHLTGYHLGKDRLKSTDYSIRTARDRNGLTNAASAIDIGKFKGLRPMSRWLVDACRSSDPYTGDIREIIYSPDGVKVLRWDRERGINSAPREGEASNSHLTHTHISYYRDSQGNNKRPLFKRYFEGDEVEWKNIDSKKDTLITIPDGTKAFDMDCSTLVKVLTNGLDDALSPFSMGGFYAIYRPIDGIRRLVMVRPTKVKPVPETNTITSFNQGVDEAAKAALTAKR